MTENKPLHPPGGQRAMEDARPDDEAEYVQYQDGDGATGANRAYGNSPRNSGARFTGAKQ